jgi:hypothetical protein
VADLLELTAKPGVSSALQAVAASSTTSFARERLADELEGWGVVDPHDVIENLVGLHLFQQSGAGLLVSNHGLRVALLLEALEGGDVDDVFYRLRRLGGSDEQYQLVRQGMTTRFFASLADRPGFGRLYFCSPWINPSEKDGRILRYAVLEIRKGGKEPEVLVITRPPEDQPEAVRASNGLAPFHDVGAKVSYLKRVHTKLYIREPDANGGYLMAIVGSENLTQSNNLELGIQINNDGRLIGQLIGHFLELSSYSTAIG